MKYFYWVTCHSILGILSLISLGKGGAVFLALGYPAIVVTSIIMAIKMPKILSAKQLAKKSFLIANLITANWILLHFLPHTWQDIKGLALAYLICQIPIILYSGLCFLWFRFKKYE